MPLPLLIIPVAVFAVSQALKILIKTYKEPFEFSHLTAYGGWPSAHTSFVTSAAVIALIEDGWNSAVFVLAVVFLIIIIRDALGIRMHLSEHGRALNKIVKESHDLNENGYKWLGERLGHTPWEIIGGLIVGVVVTLLMYAIF